MATGRGLRRVAQATIKHSEIVVDERTVGAAGTGGKRRAGIDGLGSSGAWLTRSASTNRPGRRTGGQTTQNRT